MAKVVRLVALDEAGRERGAIDGQELTVSMTEDAELMVTNGRSGLYGSITYGWEDLVPGFRRGEQVRLELQVVDEES